MLLKKSMKYVFEYAKIVIETRLVPKNRCFSVWAEVCWFFG